MVPRKANIAFSRLTARPFAGVLECVRQAGQLVWGRSSSSRALLEAGRGGDWRRSERSPGIGVGKERPRMSRVDWLRDENLRCEGGGPV